MFLILPYRTNIIPRRTPYANYALIAVNFLIFLLEYQINTRTHDFEFRQLVYYFMLNSTRPAIWQFVTYAFLHGSPLHIIGNMFFLYLFGNTVNDKLGNIGYLCFYLAGAIFSGAGHILIGGGNVLGASGAVAAVTGAYLVLFPQTLISVFLWFFIFIYTIELPALYFIAFKMILIDNIILRYTQFVAYDAHLSGYAFGIAAMVGMLATGLISTSNFDLWAMIRQWNRRRVYRDAVAGGYDPFSGRTASKWVKVKEIPKTPAQMEAEEKARQLRSEISARMNERNLSAAAQIYLELMNLDNQQILPRQQLLDIANQLTGENKHAESAQAYEQFLKYYGNYEYTEQVELMLGLIYSRYLGQREPAIKHLQAALNKLSDPGQIKMCRDELAGLQK
ncbi:MAG: rhomboid family intramembrane serine protease [Sedimentisphaerales bacterium]|nr:rhomboid family intramembrane serine protease [Sedimentisphaerales bacterium]